MRGGQFNSTPNVDKHVRPNISDNHPRDAAKIVRTTIHLVSVAVLRIKLVAFGVLFGVGPEQDLKRLPCVSDR